MSSTIQDPTPDELCSHVEAGAEMTGGWYFAARIPPVAVGMCRECIVWCKQNLATEGRQSWDDYVREQESEGDRVLSADFIG